MEEERERRGREGGEKEGSRARGEANK